MEGSTERIALELMRRLALLPAMADHGHLSAAARSIGVSQPTATRWMSALSDTAGFPLTQRSGHHIELTPAGAALAEAVRAGVHRLESGIEAAVAVDDPSQGEMRFGFLRTMGATRAPALLREYRTLRPDVRVTLVQRSHEELLDCLRTGRIDVALTHIRPDDPDVAAVELFRQPYVLVLPTDHRWSGRSHVRVYDCRDLTLVGLSLGIALRRAADEMFSAAGIKGRYAFVTDEVATVRGLVMAGVGAAVLPARDGGPLPGTVEVPLVPRQHRQVGLLISTRRPVPAPARGFVDWAGALGRGRQPRGATS